LTPSEKADLETIDVLKKMIKTLEILDEINLQKRGFTDADK